MSEKVTVEECEECLDKLDDAIENAATLTTKQRKKLKTSQFCGPGRSFPVNDCAHYTAALRLLNRSKYADSTKAKIKACINRKGKALGCSGAKKEAKASDVRALINTEIFASTVKSVEASIRDPWHDIEYYNK